MGAPAILLGAPSMSRQVLSNPLYFLGSDLSHFFVVFNRASIIGFLCTEDLFPSIFLSATNIVLARPFALQSSMAKVTFFAVVYCLKLTSLLRISFVKSLFSLALVSKSDARWIRPGRNSREIGKELD